MVVDLCIVQPKPIKQTAKNWQMCRSGLLHNQQRHSVNQSANLPGSDSHGAQSALGKLVGTHGVGLPNASSNLGTYLVMPIVVYKQCSTQLLFELVVSDYRFTHGHQLAMILV